MPRFPTPQQTEEIDAETGRRIAADAGRADDIGARRTLVRPRLAEDGHGHRRIDGRRRYRIIDEECVGCNLCQHVCPVPNCITMVPVETGKPYLNWTQHPNNPMREAAE